MIIFTGNIILLSKKNKKLQQNKSKTLNLKVTSESKLNN